MRYDVTLSRHDMQLWMTEKRDAEGVSSGAEWENAFYGRKGNGGE
jgi:hypothetical protein